MDRAIYGGEDWDEMALMEWEYEHRYDPPATEAEAHAEWHRNSGVPMGTPGCPQDACHPEDDTILDPPEEILWAHEMRDEPDDLPF